MPKVYVAACGDYQLQNVSAAVSRGLEALGGIDKLLKGRSSIAVKPNLLKADSPEECVTTHPAVVQAVLEAVIKSGRDATVTECPSGPFTAAALKIIYKATGIKEAAENAGASLNFNLESQQVSLKDGKVVKQLRVAKAFLGADAVISVAKLKTHAMMTYTGATKNLFGVVPGLSKGECHFMLPGKDSFARLITDIAELVRPPISIIDGVWGMEGDGPSAGDKRKVGVIIISDSPYAADVVAGSIINLDWRDNPVIKCAAERGLCDPDDIEVLGEDIEHIKIYDFIIPGFTRTSILTGKMPYFLEKILSKRLTIYPAFIKEKCTGCETCKRSCPADAIIMKGRLPILDKRKCINCFCCHELCPKRAVSLHRPAMLRAFSRILKKT